jgi:hypothetical protein
VSQRKGIAEQHNSSLAFSEWSGIDSTSGVEGRVASGAGCSAQSQCRY